MIVNRHAPNREIWVAAKSGGFHYRARGGRWIDTRSGAELGAALSAILREQAGLAVELDLVAPVDGVSAEPGPRLAVPPTSARRRRAAIGYVDPARARAMRRRCAERSAGAYAASNAVHSSSAWRCASWPGISCSTTAQKRREWLSSTRCATSCATT